MAYIPERGDFMRLALIPQAGRKQAGERLVLVLSDTEFNRVTSLAIIAPVTSRVRDWPFEVAIADGGRVSGVVLFDQVRNLDQAARQARFIEAAPASVLADTLDRVRLILALPA